MMTVAFGGKWLPLTSTLPCIVMLTPARHHDNSKTDQITQSAVHTLCWLLAAGCWLLRRFAWFVHASCQLP
jgi:hypothetical protein